jgi:hypothetical protein
VSNDKPTSHLPGDSLQVLSEKYGRTILLLDPFAGRHLVEDIEGLTAPPAQRLILDDPIFKDDLQSAPLLVELLNDEPTHQGVLAQSITRAQEEVFNLAGPHSVCAWLFSDVSFTRLQRAMRQRLDARYPHGGRIYLRYFDPRVMPRLAELLRSPNARPVAPFSDLAQLLGPVRTWCHLDREGLLQRHDNPQLTNHANAAYLRFDESTAAAIDRIEVINLTARALIQRAMPCKQSDDAAIDTHLLEARKLGLHSADDLVAYGWRAQHYGAPFTSQPILPGLITQAATHGIPFDAILEEHLSARAFDGLSSPTPVRAA